MHQFGLPLAIALGAVALACYAGGYSDACRKRPELSTGEKLTLARKRLARAIVEVKELEFAARSEAAAIREAEAMSDASAAASATGEAPKS